MFARKANRNKSAEERCVCVYMGKEAIVDVFPCLTRRHSRIFVHLCTATCSFVCEYVCVCIYNEFDFHILSHINEMTSNICIMRRRASTMRVDGVACFSDIITIYPLLCMRTIPFASIRTLLPRAACFSQHLSQAATSVRPKLDAACASR